MDDQHKHKHAPTQTQEVEAQPMQTQDAANSFDPTDLDSAAPDQPIPVLMSAAPPVLARETSEAVRTTNAINPHGSGL